MPIDLNLVPQPLLEAEARRRHLRAWAAGLAPAVAVVLVAAGFNWSRQTKADQTAAVAESIASQLDEARAEVRTLTAAVGEASLQLERAEALRSKRSWSGLMGLLAKARPEDVWFSSVGTDPPAPLAAKAAPARRATDPAKPAEVRPVTIDAPRKLLISGYSLSPIGPLTLVTNLKKENVFTKVVLEKSMGDAQGRESRFQFDVVVEW